MNLSAQFKRGKPKREVKSVKGLKSYWGMGARGQETFFKELAKSRFSQRIKRKGHFLKSL